MNAVGLEGLSATERLAEIAEILAAGLMRLEARKSSQTSAELEESSLHFTAAEGGDPDRNDPGETE